VHGFDVQQLTVALDAARRQLDILARAAVAATTDAR
jgi:hypothetical protein